MSLPVSQYEDLLAEVRGLRRKAQHVQQLADPLISNSTSICAIPQRPIQQDRNMESILTEKQYNATINVNLFDGASSANSATATESDDECGSSRNIQMSVSSEPSVTQRNKNVSMLYHGTWPVESTMWNSEPANLKGSNTPTYNHHLDVTSVMSFDSSSGGVPLDRMLGGASLSRNSSHQLEAKVDMVYSLLAMLSGQEHADMGETLLALSANPESCLAMRQAGCVSLLVEMVQSDKEREARVKAARAIHNLIHAQPDEKVRKREVRIFRLLEQTRAYTEALRTDALHELEATAPSSSASSEDGDRHPVQTVAHVMKLSFDEGHRQAICHLGGIHAIANLVENEHVAHGSTTADPPCILMRRYACMALTNLTFGDSGNKALLCSYREFIRALVVQLQSPSDELRQVTASVLRNLSWRADATSKEILRDVGAVAGLMRAAALDNRENTAKSILSALWNLSAHCTENKSEICAVDGALALLVRTLNYKSPTRSLAIVENAGGILRNVSSQIAVRDDYREVLRRSGCLQILLEQLRSPSLTVVSNACGTLWNLSAKCARDQETLWRLGAPAMLRSLNHSKHKMIAMGSSAALKNLLGARPAQCQRAALDATALAMDLPALPTLGARKQRALLQDLDHTLAETYENIDRDSPVKENDFLDKSQKNRFNQTETGNQPFNSLETSGPSTSSGRQQPASLPFFESATTHNVSNGGSKSGIPVRSGDVPNFVKCLPKSVAKKSGKASSSSKVGKDIGGLPCCSPVVNGEIEISGPFDNDRPKDKEVSSHSDEKDHCSIEDVSDGDGNFKPEFDPVEGVKSGGSLDEIDVEEISVQILPESESLPEDCMEKQDTGKEKPSKQTSSSGVSSCDSERDAALTTPRQIPQRRIIPKPQTSSIPLSKSFTSTSFQNSTRSSADLSSLCDSGQPLPVKRNLPTSTPIKLPAVEVEMNCGNTNLHQEVSQMQHDVNIDREVSQMRQCLTEKDPMLSANLPSISQIYNIFSVPSVSRIEQPTTFNISQENNSSQMDEVSLAKSEWGDSAAVRPIPVTSPTVPEVDPPSPDRFLHVSPSECLNPETEADRRLERSCEGAGRLVDDRMLDPDAMIESLDRFTAELVSQASSHLHNATWDDDSAPTFPSVSGSAPSVLTFDSGVPEGADPAAMTRSTLIALEASKMATAFRLEAEMATSLDTERPSRPKARKRSLPHGLVARRALSGSLNNGSSLESLDNRSLSNLDQVNPPSILGEVLDLEGSMTSVASLPDSEAGKADFGVNGGCDGDFRAGQAWHLSSDLDNVNPPSLFNEITDMCDSLADVATATIGSETEPFEDCRSKMAAGTEDDVTEFSDANSVTPIQSDASSPETSPKRGQGKAATAPGKRMTSKQKRNLAWDRYKTYTVGAAMIVREEEAKLKGDATDSTSADFKTVECFSEEFKSIDGSDDTTYVSPTYSVQKEGGSAKLTPKDRRRLDRTRFETQVLNGSVTEVHPQPPISDTPPNSAPQSPARTRLSIRRNFMQKRLENRDRFKTQTLNESSFSDSPSASPPPTSAADQDLHLLVQKEANLVLKSLRETKTSASDDLLECETMSLVSNDDDSEQNSASSVNYPTFHKSAGPRRNIPVIGKRREERDVTRRPQSENEQNESPAKPKITKPCDREPEPVEEPEVPEQPQGKGIRGRRKPLYAKSTIGNKIAPKSLKPIKTMTSNLVKNVTSTFKSNVGVNNAKPPVAQMRPKTSPTSKVGQPPKSNLRAPQKVGLERQGTFTKGDAALNGVKCKIPAPGFARKLLPPSKIPSKDNGNRLGPKSPSKSLSADRANRNVKPTYARSTSADSRDPTSRRAIQSSSSSQSLKSQTGGAVKKTSIPQMTQQKSTSQTSLNCNGSVTVAANNTSNTTRKQVTSKIASLWKKIEDSKKLQQPVKKDTRKWIGAAEPAPLIQNGTFDDQDEVILRDKTEGGTDPAKRVSRLGSFIVMDETEDGVSLQQKPVIDAEST